MNLEVAMEWLLMHSEDPDADAPLTAEQKRQLVAIYGPSKFPAIPGFGLCPSHDSAHSMFRSIRATSPNRRPARAASDRGECVHLRRYWPTLRFAGIPPLPPLALQWLWASQ